MAVCSRCKRADAEDLPAACTMLEGDPCFACKEREVIRDKIEQLEEEIAKLKAKHRALGTTMNATHDRFMHKLPPEIGSYIFRLCFPTLDYEEIHLWYKQWEWVGALKLGAVCRRWRQLAWTTPDLWDTLFLTIKSSTRRSLVESFPGLLHEWLSRCGMRPLTFFFHHHNDLSNESTVKTLNLATDLVIEIINSHSGPWKNLHFHVGADIPERLCVSIQPNQLLCLEVGIHGERSPTQKFIMKSKPFPTQLQLNNFSPISIDIGWDNITLAALRNLSANECLEVLQRAPSLQDFLAELWDDVTVNLGTTILHRRLRSLNSSCRGPQLFEAINVPSLEEWVHNTEYDPLPVTAMVSLLERSGCCLKIFKLQDISPLPDDLFILFQAMPSLERLQIHFWPKQNADGVMDDILARIFSSPPAIRSEEASRQSFLPHLQFMECIPAFTTTFPLFSWDRIPQLHRQGYRRSLTLKSTAEESHISDDTALQLLKLTDEGVNLQILDKTTRMGGDFLENFRKRMSREGG
jgi:hypothetical protein